MVRKVAPKKVAPKKVTTRRLSSNDPIKPKPWNYKDSMAMTDAEWLRKGPANAPAIPNMRMVGTVNPRFVPSNTAAPVRPHNPKFDASFKAYVKSLEGKVNPKYAPFKTPPMSGGAKVVPVVSTPKRVPKLGGGGIRGLGRKIFGER